MDNHRIENPDPKILPSQRINDKAKLKYLIEQTIIANASNLARSGHYAKAIEYIEAFKQSIEDSPAVLDLLAQIHAQQGHWSEAEEAWTQALILNPINENYAKGLKAIVKARKRWVPRSLILTAMAMLILIVIAAILVFFHPWSIPTEGPAASILPSQVPTNYPSVSLSPTTTPSPTSFLTPTSIPASFTATPLFKSCNVSTGSSTGTLNVRNGPDFSFKSIGWLTEGEKVSVLADSDIQMLTGWKYIYRAPDLKGWVSSEYCR